MYIDSFGMGTKVDTNQDLRITTGVGGLDDLLKGGFPKGSINLVSGTPGTGKTIMCFQYLNEGLKKGEKCLYLTSDERIDNLKGQAKKLGFNFEDAINSGQLKFLFLDLDKWDVHKEMSDEIRSRGYSRIVLDSLTPLSEYPVWMTNKGAEIIPSKEPSLERNIFPVDSTQAIRIHVRRLMGILEEESSTCLVTSEIPEGSRLLSRDSVSEFLVDGILILDLDTTMDRRKLTIRKMRGTKHTLKPQNIDILDGGIQIV